MVRVRRLFRPDVWVASDATEEEERPFLLLLRSPSIRPSLPPPSHDQLAFRAAACPAFLMADFFGCPRCSYRSATLFICAFNILGALYFLQLLRPFSLFSSSRGSPSHDVLHLVRFSHSQQRRIQEAVQIWKRAEPVELLKRIREIETDLSTRSPTEEEIESLKESLVWDLSDTLQKLKAASNDTKLQFRGTAVRRWKTPSSFIAYGLEQWRLNKLEEVNKSLGLKSTSNDKSKELKNANFAGVKHLLVSGWSSLLEEIGWIELDATMGQGEDIPSDTELEEEVIPGRTPPKECHTEVHTDYDGAAVRWGLTFHVESAADCCQACIDQANATKPGQLKCNIWVFCPDEAGCYSPDIYDHKRGECWLKQASQPRLNFKGKYSSEYRRHHPTAPRVVPWISGVISN